MVEACGGLFSASQVFLAAGRLNYLMAVAAAAILFSQLAFLSGGGVRLVRASARFKKSSELAAGRCPALPRLSGEAWARHIRLVPDESVKAMTAGVFSSRILLYSGMVEALDGDELIAVAAHEEAHRAGRDNLMVAIAKAVCLTLFYVPGTRTAYREMCRMLERAADLEAAHSVGGSLNVASALAKVITMSRGGRPSSAPVSFLSGGKHGDMADRLASLTGKDESGNRPLALPLFVVFAIVAIMLSFSASAFAVAGSGQRATLACFSEHSLTPGSICPLERPDHP